MIEKYENVFKLKTDGTGVNILFKDLTYESMKILKFKSPITPRRSKDLKAPAVKEVPANVVNSF